MKKGQKIIKDPDKKDLDINSKFDQKIKELEEILPKVNPFDVGCAEITLTSILDILGLHNGIFNNLMIPLSGGLAAYKSENGWSGPCGVICGGCAAIGVIIGGKEKMPRDLVQLAIIKGQQLPTAFEREFGSVVCTELCGYDFSDADVYLDYIKNNIWAKKCYKYALWVIDTVRDITQEELENNWE